MKLSTKARYALRAMVVISHLSQNDEPVSLERVSRRTRMSRGYLEQLASKLKRASLIRGITGRRGGYLLARAPEEIDLGQIVEAAIGPIGIVDCVLDPDSCAISDYCECRPIYCILNDKIKQVLCGFSLAELASGSHQALPEASQSPSADNVGWCAGADLTNEEGEQMVESTGKKSVLVVEDEPDQRSYLTTLLADSGYAVVEAKNGKEALEVVRREKPGLITLDISMPEESGLRFYRELRGDPEIASTPVVIVTGVTGHGGDSAAFERFLGTRKGTPPPEGFIAKPIDKQELLTTVASLLA